MFFLSLALIGGGIWGIVDGSQVNNLLILNIILGVIAIIVAFVIFFGLMVIEPNQARVLVFFG